MISLLLCLLVGSAFAGSNFTAVKKASSQQITGYLENWGPMTKWWDNNIPGNCLMGCEQPSSYMKSIANYTAVNYGFTFLTRNPNPDQVGCTASTCPVWDGKAIWIASAGHGSSAIVVSAGNDADPIAKSPGIVTIGESCRMARQGPYPYPKRCRISFGGWSDWARIGSSDNAKKIARMVANMVLYSFADGIDLDFEHLSPFDKLNGNGHSEFQYFSELINEIRNQYETYVKPSWYQAAKNRAAWLQKKYNGLPDWQRKQSYYYPTNIKYMQDIQSNPLPTLEITWTTRFNAFLPDNNPYNYLLPDSPVPSDNFESDQEGKKLWPSCGSNIDFVNIMAYDAGTAAGALKLNFTRILLNFVQYGGVPKDKLIMGFEPGHQAAGGHWEGFATDLANTRYIRANGYGGTMVWAINDAGGKPYDAQLTSAMAQILNPSYPYPPAPKFTSCNSRTGWTN